MHLLQHLRRVSCIVAAVAVAVFLIQSHALAPAFAVMLCVTVQSVNSASLFTFNPFNDFAESVSVYSHPFSRLYTKTGNSCCMISLLISQIFNNVAVYVNDFMPCQQSDVQGNLAKVCDKAAQEVFQVQSKANFQCHSRVEIVAAGFCDTLPVVAEYQCDNPIETIQSNSPKAAFAPAFARVRAADKEETTPACLLVKTVDKVHFARSVPCYIPAELNGGGSGTVIMRSLHEHSSAQAVFGGSMTMHRDRTGRRVRKHAPRFGTVCKGKVSCDKDGRINARRINNDSLQAIAAARKLFHEVYGRSAQFQRSTITNAVVKADSTSLNWIADTGASLDFIGKKRLNKYDKKRLVKMQGSKRCSTGNGSVTIDYTLKSTWGDGQKANAWVMPGEAPPCVSVGQKCLREGLGFYWTPFSPPVMVSPQGTCYKMTTNRNVPTLPGDDEHHNIYSASTHLINKMNAMIQSAVYGGDYEQFHHVDDAGGDETALAPASAEQSSRASSSTSIPNARDMGPAPPPTNSQITACKPKSGSKLILQRTAPRLSPEKVERARQRLRRSSSAKAPADAASATTVADAADDDIDEDWSDAPTSSNTDSPERKEAYPQKGKRRRIKKFVDNMERECDYARALKSKQREENAQSSTALAPASACEQQFPPQPPLPGVNASRIKPLTWNHFITHSPKHPRCPVCQKCKVQKSIVKKTDVDHSVPPPVNFGDIITLDWGLISEWGKARAGEIDIMVYLDRGTRWVYSHPSENRTNDEIILGFSSFLGSALPTPKLCYSDNGPEILKAYKRLGFPKDTSQPHRAATNGVAERAQRTVKEGTSCFLSQAGLQMEWWVEAAKCYCFLRNAWDQIPSGPHAGCTSYQARFKEDCPAQVAMFGQEVEYNPIDQTTKQKIHKFQEKT